jgi:hypothetical protein
MIKSIVATLSQFGCLMVILFLLIAYPDLEEEKLCRKITSKLVLVVMKIISFFDLYFHNKEFFSILDEKKRNKIKKIFF